MPSLIRFHNFLLNKESNLTQIIKYALCGGISIIVDSIVFYLMAWLVLPCLKPGDPVVKLLESLGFTVQPVDPDLLIRNFWIIKSICFIAVNITVYILNILYVFERGRYRTQLEIMIFFGISLCVFLSGTWLGAFLIDSAEWQITYTYVFVLSLVVTGNYVLRKFVVFKR
jgi:putative flippase GtrA